MVIEISKSSETCCSAQMCKYLLFNGWPLEGFSINICTTLFFYGYRF